VAGSGGRPAEPEMPGQFSTGVPWPPAPSTLTLPLHRTRD
jgi:hypothetical protein